MLKIVDTKNSKQFENIFINDFGVLRIENSSFDYLRLKV